MRHHWCTACHRMVNHPPTPPTQHIPTNLSCQDVFYFHFFVHDYYTKLEQYYCMVSSLDCCLMQMLKQSGLVSFIRMFP